MTTRSWWALTRSMNSEKRSRTVRSDSLDMATIVPHLSAKSTPSPPNSVRRWPTNLLVPSRDGEPSRAADALSGQGCWFTSVEVSQSQRLGTERFGQT